MQVRATVSRFAVLALVFQSVALAQANPSLLGSWQSSTMMIRDWPYPFSVRLTITSVGADQLANGTFRIFIAGGGGMPNFCLSGPVSGRFDGTALKMTSPSSNLCAERLFDLKLSGDELAGLYRGADGNQTETTFKRAQ